MKFPVYPLESSENATSTVGKLLINNPEYRFWRICNGLRDIVTMHTIPKRGI